MNGCCYLEQSFLFNFQCHTVVRKVANKIARAMLPRNKRSLQQNIFVKVTKTLKPGASIVPLSKEHA